MRSLLNQTTTTHFLITQGYKSVSNDYNNILNESSNVNDSIPKFYTSFRVNKPNCFTNIITSLSIENTLNNMVDMFPTQEDVDCLRDEFEQMLAAPGLPVLGVKRQNRTMRYMQYQELRKKWPKRLQHLLSAKLFIEIGGSSTNTMQYEKFFEYLYFLPKASQHFIELRSYDPFRTGIISELAFSRYVDNFASRMSFVSGQIEQIPQFLKFYVSIIVGFVFVSVDPLGTGVAPLKELMKSPFLYYFINLDPNDEDCQIDRENIFSLHYATYLVNEFKNLDSDNDGILKGEDLMNITGLNLTETFTQSAVSSATCPLPNFQWFVKFKAAWDYLGEQWANAYFFEILDTDGDGILTEHDFNIYLKDVRKYASELLEGEKVPASFSLGEFLDLMQIKDAKITKENFKKSSDSGVLVRVLCDASFFISTMMTSEDISS